MRRSSRFPHKAAIPVALLIATTLSAYGYIVLHSTGWVGATLRDGANGCSCHGLVASDSVRVWISGPDTVALGGFAEYVVAMTGGPAVAGGFNVASSHGALSAADTTVRLLGGELTHSVPKAFQNDTVTWRFLYQAPLSGSLDTLFSVGNSTNGNGHPTGDAFNFGANFSVHLADSILGSVAARAPVSFQLGQNYPNPFNPGTHLEIGLRSRAYLSVKVFNTLGQNVALLAEGMREPGAYTLTFDGAALPSGIYFCRVQVGMEVGVRKMVLAR